MHGKSSDDAILAAFTGPAFYTTAARFKAAAIANHFCWQASQYDYPSIRLNACGCSVLEMSAQGWPGGLA